MRPDIGAALSDASLERNVLAAAWRPEPVPRRRVLPVSLVPHIVLGGRWHGNERGARNQPKPHRNSPDDASHPATPLERRDHPREVAFDLLPYMARATCAAARQPC